MLTAFNSKWNIAAPDLSGDSGSGFLMSYETLCMSCNPFVALPLHFKSSQARNPSVLISGTSVTHPRGKGSRGVLESNLVYISSSYTNQVCYFRANV